MDFTTKKNVILDAIAKAEPDDDLINELYEVLHPQEEVFKIDESALPKDLQEKIARGMNDYQKGRYTQNDAMKQKAEEWLKD